MIHNGYHVNYMYNQIFLRPSQKLSESIYPVVFFYIYGKCIKIGCSTRPNIIQGLAVYSLMQISPMQ